jgi:DNA-binding SARP family transcriptional activator
VAVLGPVEIRGAAHPFCRAASRELVVYLAFHRQGARSDAWSTALWTERRIAPSTLHSTASVARQALGRSQAGTEHLPRGGQTLRLADTVGSDVERFALAAADPDPERWMDALALVRGRPFEGLHLADWSILEGTQAQLEKMVADTSLRTAELALERRHGEEAEWAIRRGLRVSPYDERLYRGLLMAREMMGNRAGMRSVMEEIICLASDGVGRFTRVEPGTVERIAQPFVHPTTVALFRELSEGRAPGARGDPPRL